MLRTFLYFCIKKCFLGHSSVLMNKEDSCLLKKLRDGDMAALEFLYVRYAPQVKSFVYAFMKDAYESDDIVHDVFLKVWEDRMAVSQAVSFKSYLFRMTRNMIFDRMKRKDVHSRFVNYVMTGSSDIDNQEKRILTKDLLELIGKEIDSLPEKQKEIYSMNRAKDLTYNEISEKLGVSPKTVQYHIGVVLSKLRKILN